MKIKSLTIFLSLCVGLIYFSCQNKPTPESYAKQLLEERAEKDVFMKSDAESPFKTSPGEYKGLQYYAPDLTYRVKASLMPIEDKKTVVLSTSDNKENEYLEFGYVTFTLKGNSCKLLILEITESGTGHGTLFLAFADSTSARQTYGGGRYLDLKKIPGMTSLILDFNKAYNPYCAYNDNFSCPIPPKENILKVAVAAGEKLYH